MPVTCVGTSSSTTSSSIVTTSVATLLKIEATIGAVVVLGAVVRTTIESSCVGSMERGSRSSAKNSSTSNTNSSTKR